VSKIDNFYNTLALDNDATNLYVSGYTSGLVSQILSYRKSDNTKTVLYQGPSSTSIPALIVAGGYIYFSEAGTSSTVYRINTTASLQTPVSVGTGTFGFAKNSARVYWTDMPQYPCNCAGPKTYHVYSVAIGGTSPATFSLAMSEISPDIEVDENYLYAWGLLWSSTNGAYTPGLSRFSLTNPFGDSQTLVPGYFVDKGITYNLKGTGPASAAITKNSTYVIAASYFTGPSGGLAVFKVQSNGTVTRSTVAQGWLPLTFKADDTNIYLDNQRMPVAGGALSYYSAHEAVFGSLTLDSTSAYFASLGYGTTYPFADTFDVTVSGIYKVAK
jgi:hypothetical protein